MFAVFSDPAPAVRGSGGASSERLPRALWRRRGRKRDVEDAEGGCGRGGRGTSIEAWVAGAVLGPGDVDGRRCVLAGVTVALDAEAETRPECDRVRTVGRLSRISGGLGGVGAGGEAAACVSSESDGMDDCDCPDELNTPPSTDHRRRRLLDWSPVLALVNVECDSDVRGLAGTSSTGF